MQYTVLLSKHGGKIRDIKKDEKGVFLLKKDECKSLDKIFIDTHYIKNSNNFNLTSSIKLDIGKIISLLYDS